MPPKLFSFSAAVKSVNPFYKRIRTQKEQDEYFEDYLKIAIRKGFALEDVQANRKTCAIYAPYKLMIVYAKKDQNKWKWINLSVTPWITNFVQYFLSNNLDLGFCDFCFVLLSPAHL